MSEAFGKGLKTLVVDDDPQMLMVLTRALSREGFAVETAEDYKTAIGKCGSDRFDLVVVDKNLPDGSGIDLAKEASDLRPDCAVIIVTGYGSLESAIEAMRAHVADYLLKPITMSDFRERIWRVVKQLVLKREHSKLCEALDDKTRAFEELRELAARDPLTGLYNHAYIQQRLAKELNRSHRFAHNLSLLFIDIDGFKNVNDTFGHPVGDSVLKRIAHIMREGDTGTCEFRLREYDVSGRYGGDEFIMLLPETNKAGAATTGERLRACIAEIDFGPNIEHVTISVGVASFPDDANDRDQLISAADAALYVAKHSGRNRVTAYSSGLKDGDSADQTVADSEANRLMALHNSIANRAFRFDYEPVLAAQDESLVGYHALFRPEMLAFSTPDEVISTAEGAGLVFKLGRVLREMAAEPLERFPEGCGLFLDLQPLEVNDPLLLEGEPFMDPAKQRVVLWINRVQEVNDQGRLRDTLTRLRERGYEIGLSELSPDYRALHTLDSLSPTLLKLPRSSLTEKEPSDRSNRRLKHMLEFARGEGITVVMPGIESDQERTLAAELGCQLLQGPHLSQTSKHRLA